MKLQKQLSRKVGDTEYAKWVLVALPAIIKELSWKERARTRSRSKG